jgi:hypothetical protein
MRYKTLLQQLQEEQSYGFFDSNKQKRLLTALAQETAAELKTRTTQLYD